jgi:hypothetical protein
VQCEQRSEEDKRTCSKTSCKECSCPMQLHAPQPSAASLILGSACCAHPSQALGGA